MFADIKATVDKINEERLSLGMAKVIDISNVTSKPDKERFPFIEFLKYMGEVKFPTTEGINQYTFMKKPMILVFEALSKSDVSGIYAEITRQQRTTSNILEFLVYKHGLTSNELIKDSIIYGMKDNLLFYRDKIRVVNFVNNFNLDIEYIPAESDMTLGYIEIAHKYTGNKSKIYLMSERDIHDTPRIFNEYLKSLDIDLYLSINAPYVSGAVDWKDVLLPTLTKNGGVWLISGVAGKRTHLIHREYYQLTRKTKTNIDILRGCNLRGNIQIHGSPSQCGMSDDWICKMKDSYEGLGSGNYDRFRNEIMLQWTD